MVLEGLQTEATMAPEVSGATTKDSRAWEALTPSLSQWLLEAIATMGMKRMTPVQAATIPLFKNKDVIVEVRSIRS